LLKSNRWLTYSVTHPLSPGSSWTTDASFRSMRFLRVLALAWPARSPNSLVANLTKAHPAFISAPALISRPPYRVFTLRAMPLVRDTTPRGRLPVEVLQESPPTNRFLGGSPFGAEDPLLT